jgi:hypothetical protein
LDYRKKANDAFFCAIPVWHSKFHYLMVKRSIFMAMEQASRNAQKPAPAHGNYRQAGVDADSFCDLRNGIVSSSVA